MERLYTFVMFESPESTGESRKQHLPVPARLDAKHIGILVSKTNNCRTGWCNSECSIGDLLETERHVIPLQMVYSCVFFSKPIKTVSRTFHTLRCAKYLFGTIC